MNAQRGWGHLKEKQYQLINDKFAWIAVADKVKANQLDLMAVFEQLL